VLRPLVTKPTCKLARVSIRARLLLAGVLVGLLGGAALVALLPFRASTEFVESGWFAYAPDEPTTLPARSRTVVEGDCGAPLVAAWPTERDRVRSVTHGSTTVRYEADGRLGRSCDAPAARRLALSAALLVPAGILLAVLARRGVER
jgi:hypothetical protein